MKPGHSTSTDSGHSRQNIPNFPNNEDLYRPLHSPEYRQRHPSLLQSSWFAVSLTLNTVSGKSIRIISGYSDIKQIRIIIQPQVFIHVHSPQIFLSLSFPPVFTKPILWLYDAFVMVLKRNFLFLNGILYITMPFTFQAPFTLTGIVV